VQGHREVEDDPDPLASTPLLDARAEASAPAGSGRPWEQFVDQERKPEVISARQAMAAAKVVAPLAWAAGGVPGADQASSSAAEAGSHDPRSSPCERPPFLHALPTLMNSVNPRLRPRWPCTSMIAAVVTSLSEPPRTAVGLIR